MADRAVGGLKIQTAKKRGRRRIESCFDFLNPIHFFSGVVKSQCSRTFWSASIQFLLVQLAPSGALVTELLGRAMFSWAEDTLLPFNHGWPPRSPLLVAQLAFLLWIQHRVDRMPGQ